MTQDNEKNNTATRRTRRGRPSGQRKTLGLRRQPIPAKPTLYLVAARTDARYVRLDDSDIEDLANLLLAQADFCGIDVIAYSIIPTTMKAVIRVPTCPYDENGNHGIDDEELVRRHASFYKKDAIPLSAIGSAELATVLAEGGIAAETARKPLLTRMGDLSIFMKELKQRYTFHYNRKHDTGGSVWAERFRSLIIEDEAAVLGRLPVVTEDQ